MARAPKAGDLAHLVAFDMRPEVDDGAGNTHSGPFTEQFRDRAAFSHRGGSEAVMAARLEGRQILGVYVRSSALTRQITSDWQMRDLRAGTAYAIDAVDTVTDPKWVYLIVESGRAA